MYQSNPDLGIIHFEGDWMKFSNDAAAAAYAWALANIEYIVHSGGMSDLNRLMDRLATGESDRICNESRSAQRLRGSGGQYGRLSEKDLHPLIRGSDIECR